MELRLWRGRAWRDAGGGHHQGGGEEVGLEVAIEYRLGDRIQPVSKRHMHYFICRVIGGDLDLVDHEENTEVAWCMLDEVYAHFEELARIPDGMYKPLFEYLDRVLVKDRLAKR